MAEYTMLEGRTNQDVLCDHSEALKYFSLFCISIILKAVETKSIF
jgi:hypothetical protein